MYTVERTIEDVQFDERQVQEIRERIKKELIEDNPSMSTFPDGKVERLLRERLAELAQDSTLSSQGHNDLHLDISHGEVEKE